MTDPILERLSEEFLAQAGQHDWHFAAALAPEQQDALLASCDVLVCARLTAEQARGCSARYVHITGIGADRVAVAQLPAGTIVSRTGHHERSIAEHIVMVSMIHQRRLLETNRELQAGVWRTVATAPDVPMNPTFSGLTFGFVGLGGIGEQALALCTALGARSVAVRRNPDGELSAGLDWVKGMDALPELLAISDVVVLGVPLTAQTTGLIGARQLAQMRSNALLVNVARGAVIDEEALFEALVSNSIGGAALDVWWDAPAGTTAPESVRRFAQLPNVIATPHNSGHTLDTFGSRAREIAQNITAFADGRTPSNQL
ncbi:2-hydroxyacid dehydrogenase [Glutamicibacter sp. JL.03c]|uniref:2-hydroxyacid dehydrogenase n=1 Tax=Glutamicibacter sp. JL.03c TaxID=2984842 RepID=UPI0021F72E25|nr:2-hydroxyacid dehydrogenase [Glutamicibacter sp. JL.03c]UYQ77002.1 2-hydroxyacid dehydrogenase [Glutamicibacter sp. JL.03c]